MFLMHLYLGRNYCYVRYNIIVITDYRDNLIGSGSQIDDPQ